MKLDKTETWKTIAYVGAALIIAGGLRAIIQETLLWPSKVMLIGGGVLLLAAIGFNFRDFIGFFKRRSSKLSANLLLAVLAVLVILVVINFLGKRYHKRWDLTSEQLYSLSDQTRQVVRNLQQDLKLIQFAKDDSVALQDRMKEYEGISRRISFERIDPQERPEVARQYQIASMGETILVSGDKIERLQNTNEEDITNAILKITRDAVKTVCFVEGHGEKSIASSAGDGYAGVEQGLQRDNYRTRAINLVAENGVPAECSVTVVAGPKQTFFPQEEVMLETFLNGGGKVLLLLDPDTEPGLARVLEEWNIKVGDDIVLDTSGVGRLFGAGPAVPLVRSYGNHPIARDFEGSMTFFPLARSVNKADQQRFEPSVQTFLSTSEQSWAETELKGDSAKFDDGRDTQGPVSLGAAASRMIPGSASSSDGRPSGERVEREARLVVIGDSGFAENNYINMQRNGDLFLNTINWLAQDEDLISIRPKRPTDRRVTMTQSQQNWLFWLSVVFLPGAALLAGIVVWWKRR